MAEEVLFNTAGGIIKRLAPLVAEEIGLLWGVQNELEKLQDTVSTIKDVLLDAEEKQAGNRAINGWLRKLNDLLYEADDLLDDISTETQRREIMTGDKKAKEVRIFFSKSNQFDHGPRMGYKIKAIRERLDAVVADISKLRFLVRPLETRVWIGKRDDTYSSLGSKIVIGRKDDKKEIIDRLMEPNIEGNVSIISIVGIGGLGKTTLAKLIFDDREVQKQFKAI